MESFLLTGYIIIIAGRTNTNANVQIVFSRNISGFGSVRSKFAWKYSLMIRR